MNTTDKSDDWLERLTKYIGGVGALAKALGIFIAGVGVLLLAIHEFPILL